MNSVHTPIMTLYHHLRILNNFSIMEAILRHQHDTGRAQVKTWYSLDKINSYTTNTIVLVNEINLTLRIDMINDVLVNAFDVY